MSSEARHHFENAPLFAGLPPEAIDRLEAASRISDAPRGLVLFQQGDDSDGLYILLSGTATLSILAEDGQELILEIARPGAVFGELALLDGLSRSATCTMREDGRVLRLGRGPFLSLLDEPAFARRILSALSVMLRQTTMRVERMAHSPLFARVAQALIANADTGTPPQVSLTQQELALICGAARPRVNEALKRLEMRGAIAREGRRLLLLDPEALAAIGEERAGH